MSVKRTHTMTTVCVHVLSNVSLPAIMCGFLHQRHAIVHTLFAVQYTPRHDCMQTHFCSSSLMSACALCRTHVMIRDVEKSSVPSRPRRQSAFFLWRWCISPPQLSQQRHMQKKRPTTGISTVKRRPTAAHTRKPIS